MKIRSLIYVGVLATAALAQAAGAQTFTFAALGDLAYSLPRDTDRYAGLTQTVNAADPAFSIHVGDVKGYTSCSDDALLLATRFERFDRAVFYTPGDNDWADCAGEEPGAFEPLERLTALRRLFFSGDVSNGARPLPLIRQASTPENARWTQSGVVFATIHATGPHNNFTVSDRALAEDAQSRIDAGAGWLREAFLQAKTTNAPALVVAFHADPWAPGAASYEGGPLDWIRQIVRSEALGFRGQVLLVHGDSHRLIIDQPFRRADIEAGTTVGLNITRLQVPGWPDHRSVLVTVETEDPAVFSFRPLVPAGEFAGARP